MLPSHTTVVLQSLLPCHKHICVFCTRDCTEMNEKCLQENGLIHSDTRPFTCNQCSKAFNFRTCPKMHQRAVHENVCRFRCTQCSHIATTQYNSHERMSFITVTAQVEVLISHVRRQHAGILQCVVRSRCQLTDASPTRTLMRARQSQ